jgi:hypothetical protein
VGFFYQVTTRKEHAVEPEELIQNTYKDHCVEGFNQMATRKDQGKQK